jgi:SAM-dependent methyltransferase
MANDDFILKFYKNVAHNYGSSASSSMQDETIRRLESQFILSEIDDFIKRHELFPRILELGCGNAYLLSLIQKNYPGILQTGLEFSPELCSIAQARKLPYTKILHADMRKIEEFPHGLYDIVITQRSVINLSNWEEQKRVLKTIYQKLNFPGRYICVESYMEPWRDLNTARKEVHLPPLKPSIQNVYLKDKSRKLLLKLGLFKRRTNISENALSSHFFHSRVIHPLIRPQGARLKSTQLVRHLDETRAVWSRAYSPILLRSYEKTLSSVNCP